MSTTLPASREAFVTAMNRDTAGSDRSRYMTILDALIGWSLARPDQLAFREEESARGVLSFRRVGSNVVFWSVRPMRSDCPQVELVPRANSILSEQHRGEARDAINAVSRELLEENDKLSIGFSALKKPDSREAIFNLMTRLLEQVQ